MNEALLDAESAWAGALPGSGDFEAGELIQSIPGYEEYRRVLLEKLRGQLGDEFILYRAMTREAYEKWRSGEPQGASGFTLNTDFAKAWENFGTSDGNALVIVRALIRPEWVIMRGKPEDDELVVDFDKVPFEHVRVI
jgi:hypothetical protein